MSKSSLILILASFGLCHGWQSQVPRANAQNYPVVPPAQAWQKLNASVQGRLVPGLPVGLPCYNNFNGEKRTPDAAACQALELYKNTTGILVSRPGGYTQGNWGLCQSSDVGCPMSPFTEINPNATCNSGNIAPYFLNVSSVSDVQKAFTFANKYNYPVVVKNSGHDYKGRSASPNALALWVNNYNPAPVFHKSFVPDGCTKQVGNVITFGAGQDFHGLYAFADKNNAIVVGGAFPSVRPGGGWVTGGGHSYLSPVYGLGVDNVQQIRVVLPNGTYVTANHCQNQDLFFALRGGGGGTFGVNMEISTLAHPSVPMQFARLSLPSNTSFATRKQLLSIEAENANTWFDQGWGGHSNPTGPVNQFEILNSLLTYDQAKASLKPIYDFAGSLGLNVTLITYPSYYAFFSAVILNSPLNDLGNYGLAQSSRIVPRANLADPKSQTAVVDAISSAVFNPNSTFYTSLLLMFTTPRLSIRDSDSSTTPAWRNATWHAIYTTLWDPTLTNTSTVQNNFRMISEAIDPLRALTPDSGAYLNEGDTFEPDPIDTFWGRENYDRLVKIKEEVDPKGLMVVHQGIGSEKASKERFACYPDVRS